MADSPSEKAAKAVATACAACTTVVKVNGLNPLDVSPNNLFKLTFSAIGIISDAQIEAFRQTLRSVLPDALTGDIGKMAVSPGIEIGLVVDHVEALLDALP